MSYNINVDDWYDDAITLKAKGFSTRKIAVALFNNENHRNRLNIFYKQESVIEDVEKRAKELEIEDSVIGVQLQNDYSNWEVKPKPELNIKPTHSKQTILVIADTQCKSEENLEYMLWIGHYIAEKQPDVIIHIGDHYDFNESYKGWTGNNHFRGLTVLHEVSDGFATPMFVSLDYMKEKYYG